jgi:hypothetical protein
MEYYKSQAPDLIVPILLELFKEEILKDSYYRKVMVYWVSHIISEWNISKRKDLLTNLISEIELSFPQADEIRRIANNFVKELLWSTDCNFCSSTLQSILSKEDQNEDNLKYKTEKFNTNKFQEVQSHGWDIIWAAYFATGKLRYLQMICDGIRSEDHVNFLLKRRNHEVVEKKFKIDEMCVYGDYAKKSLIFFGLDDDVILEHLKVESTGDSFIVEEEKLHTLSYIISNIYKRRSIRDNPIPLKVRRYELLHTTMDLLPLDGRLVNIPFKYIPKNFNSKIGIARGSANITPYLIPLISNFQNV